MKSMARNNRIPAPRIASEAQTKALLKILALGEEQVKQGKTRPIADVVRELRAAVKIPAANVAALERAYKRAEASKAAMLKRPDMLTLAQFARRVKSRVSVIDGRRAANKLLALNLAPGNGTRYPEWQCDLVLDAKHRKAYESALGALGEGADFDKYRFFTTASPALGGRTPIEALEGDEVETVVRAAETWASGEQGGG
jgi:hypothetical protein